MQPQVANRVSWSIYQLIAAGLISLPLKCMKQATAARIRYGLLSCIIGGSFDLDAEHAGVVLAAGADDQVIPEYGGAAGEKADTIC